MKMFIDIVKNHYKIWLPFLVLVFLLVGLTFGYEKYYSLQPLWQVYLVSIVFQIFCWAAIIRLNEWELSEFKKSVAKPVKLAFAIGFVWSVIQIVWQGGWWTWLNLISQPFIYALVASGLIHLYLISIDQINKIRHHDVG